MKRLTVVLFVISMFTALAACAWFEIDKQTSETIAKISSRRIGSEVQFKHPGIAEEIYKVCKQVLTDVESGEHETLKNYVRELLQQHVDDPLLASDIIDLVNLIEIKPNVSLTEDQVGVIKAIAEGFTSGIEFSGGP